MRVSGLTDIKEIAAGGGWTMAVKSNGQVWTWGQNDAGQLGDGTQTNRLTPVQIAGDLSGKTITAIAAGDYHGLALDSTGAVYGWGNNSNGQVGNGTNTDQLTPDLLSGLIAASIAAGSQHSLARLSDGTVKAWGWNQYGQIGDGTNISRNMPTIITTLSGVSEVSAGGDFSLALKTDGTIRAWGHNRYGQLGDGTLTDQNVPVNGGIIPVIQIASADTPAGVVTRGADNHLLYQISLQVSDADATLTGLTLTTNGNYETSDIRGFTLRYSADTVLDNEITDPVLAVYDAVPPYGSILFDGFEQPMDKGTFGYLFVTMDISEDPVAERYIFIDEIRFDQFIFAERNVFKSGNEPLPAGGRQTFPVITVGIGSTAVSAATVRQNTTNTIIYKLNLSKTDGPENAILSGLTVTTGGTYYTSF